MEFSRATGTCRVLIVEESERIATDLKRELAKRLGNGLQAELSASRDGLRSRLRDSAWDIVISGEPPRVATGEALALVRELAPGTPFLVVARDPCEKSANLCLADGAADYIALADAWKLGHLVSRELAVAAERRRLSRLEKSADAQAVHELIGRVSHDFNNLAGMLAIAVDLAEAELARGGAPRTASAMRRIRSVQERASAFAARLTSLHCQEAERGARILLDPTVEELAELFSALVGDRIYFELRLGAPNCCAGISRHHFERILTNLVTNARDAVAPRGGKIRVATERASPAEARRQGLGNAAGFLKLIVADDGPGIPPEHLERVFEPRFTTKAHGSGLGLAIVRELAAEHGGIVSLESELGRGCVFTVWLPEAEAEEKLQAASSSQ